MNPEPVIDAEVVSDVTELAAASTQLARRERRSEVMHPLPAEQLVQSFREYQELCEALLDDSDYQRAERGKRFKKKSAWRKLATAFDLDVIRVTDSVERNEAGHPVRASAVYRAIAPSGRVQDGDGYCSVDEPRFDRQGGRQKLENDLRATATTRAKNRAISDLLGTGEVSAEELSGSPPHDGPPYGPEYDKAVGKVAGLACVTLCGGDPDRGKRLWKQIVAELGYMPQAVVVALIAAADPPGGLPESEPESDGYSAVENVQETLS